MSWDILLFDLDGTLTDSGRRTLPVRHHHCCLSEQLVLEKHTYRLASRELWQIVVFL